MQTQVSDTPSHKPKLFSDFLTSGSNSIQCTKFGVDWAHSMGTQRSPLSRVVVVVVVVDIARRLCYSYSWCATSDTW